MSKRCMPIMAVGYRANDDLRELRSNGCCWAVIQLPWAMLEPHAAQAERNHSQTLERLAERGGLSACEALAVLEDRPFQKMKQSEANARLASHLIDFAVD